MFVLRFVDAHVFYSYISALCSFLVFIKEIQDFNQKILVSGCSIYPKGRCEFELAEVNTNRSGICSNVFLGSGRPFIVKSFLINSRVFSFIKLICTEVVYPLL